MDTPKLPKIKVENMQSPNGNDVPNQFIIRFENMSYFQSYDSIIACLVQEKGKFTETIYLDKRYWDYSVTTGKYRNMFLGMNKKEIQEMINSGDIQLVNLNE